MQLKQFNKDELYSNILEYWYEEWESFSEVVKKGSVGIEIVNIRITLLDIINEYELNRFESENNRKVYLNLIQKFISEKHMKLYRDELLILKDILEKKDSQAVYVIAKELSKKISSANFSQLLFDELEPYIKSKSFSRKDRTSVKNITKDIIIDLVTSGRNIDDIKNLLSDVFKSYVTHKDETLILLKYTPENLSPELAKEYIDSLSIKDRLEIFRGNLLANQSDYIFIFPVWGMIAPHHLTDENDTLFGFQVYDPYRERKIPNNSDFVTETFNTNYQEKSDKDDSRCNVLIKVPAISIKVAKKTAEEKFSVFLSILNFNFGDKYKEIYWDGQYIARKTDTHNDTYSTPFSINRDEKVLRRNLCKDSPIYFSDEKYKKTKNYSNVIKLLNKDKLYLQSNTIVNVIQLMSKSIWETEENKLLNYWICIESLANISKRDNESIFNFIKETISNMYFLWERFRPVYTLFSLTDYYTRHSYNKDDFNNIPEEFLKDVGIYESRSEDSKVPLDKFYKRMHELSKYTQKESFLDSIEDTINFYQNNKEALQKLKRKKDEVKLTIDYIYKSRNQIVHNGYVAKNLIPYLVDYAEGYAESLLQRIIDVYLQNEFDLRNHFINEKFEGELLEKRLSSKDFYDIGL